MLFANISNAKLMLVYLTAQKTGIDLLFEQESKFQGNIFNFSRKFCLTSPQNWQFDFDFWKSPIKIVNVVICGKKLNARYGKQTCFLFCLNLATRYRIMITIFLMQFESSLTATN